MVSLQDHGRRVRSLISLFSLPCASDSTPAHTQISTHHTHSPSTRVFPLTSPPHPTSGDNNETKHARESGFWFRTIAEADGQAGRKEGRHRYRHKQDEMAVPSTKSRMSGDKKSAARIIINRFLSAYFCNDDETVIYQLFSSAIQLIESERERERERQIEG